MTAPNASLLIPVENQVRELDPKLLLACVAARRGFTSILGSRREIHFNITAFPRSIYLSKSITSASDWVFAILRHLGHEIVAWDEEALVHLPPETYFSRRLSPAAMARVSHFFAWGQDNVELWEGYSQLPSSARIHISGNPRNDLLRAELRPFYEAQVRDIRAAYGDFILINTNFNHVNAFSPVQNLFKPATNPGEEPAFGRAAKGMTRAYAEGLRNLKQAVFNDFKQLVPSLDRAFPGHTIVVRPHPTESQAIYHQIAEGCKRVKVTNAGNVVPWLMAARALIHNGCTTGVEAFAMGVPAITYRASVDERYDLGFYRLPNLLSHQCFDRDQVEDTLRRILAGEIGAAGGEERQRILDRYLAALDGPLACERIVDVLEEMMNTRGQLSRPDFRNWCAGHLKTFVRNRVKRFKARLPGSHNRPEFQSHRYPQIPLDDMRDRVRRIQYLLGERSELRVEPVRGQFFRIAP